MMHSSVSVARTQHISRHIAGAGLAPSRASSAGAVAASFDWAGLVCEEVRGLNRPFLVIRGALGFAACGYVSADFQRY